MARQRDEEDDTYEDEAPRRKAPSRRKKGAFEFDGKAGDFFPVFLVAMLLYVFTFGIGGAWSACMIKNWECEHTTVNGRRLRFNGTGGSLFVLFLVTYFLSIFTLGIYMFWGIPKITGWFVENTDFGDEE